MSGKAKTPLEIRIDKLYEDAKAIEGLVPRKDEQKAYQQSKQRIRRRADALQKNELAAAYLYSTKFNGVNILNDAVKRGRFFLASVCLKNLLMHPDKTAPTVGKSALHYATEYEGDNKELFEKLIESHANVDAVDVYGTSVLHLAVYNDKLEHVRILLSKKASSLPSHFGYAAHIAAYYGRTEMCVAIIGEHHEEANRVHQGLSPIECSAFVRETECLLSLSQVCTLDKSIIYKVICSRDSDEEARAVVEQLLLRGVDANRYDTRLFEEVPILAAARRGWINTVHALLEPTEPIAGVVWTAENLIDYARSDEQMKRNVVRVNVIKQSIIWELKNRQLLLGCCLFKSVRCYLDPLDLEKYDALCASMLTMGMRLSFFCDYTPEQFLVRAQMYLGGGATHLAQLLAKAGQLLDPNSLQLRDFVLEIEQGRSGASSSNSG